jgi:hypothetical protein
MKHILDSSFRYRPSFDTDVRKTFERIRRQQQPKADKPMPATVSLWRPHPASTPSAIVSDAAPQIKRSARGALQR